MPFVNTKMTDSGSGNSAYKVAGLLPSELTNSNKYANAASGVVKALSNAVDWLTTPKMPDSYLAHNGVGPNGLTGSTNNTLASALSNAGKEISNIVSNGLSAVSSIGSSSNSYSGSSGSGGYTSGYGSVPVSGFGSYQNILDMVNDTAQKNNEWSAEQARLDREWQEKMSSTAHQREVADLQAAGLNPVLSAGGSGASTPSGAMGQTDTSNTRVLAEVMMTALGTMANTAVGCATAAAGANGNIDNSLFGRITNAYSSNKLVKKLIDTGLNTAGSIARLGIVKALF